MTIGERITALREARGLSQYALSQKMGVSQSQLGKVERGLTPNPGAKMLAKIAAALEVTVDEITTGAGAPSAAAIARPLPDPRIPETLAAIARIETELSDLRKSLTSGAQKMTIDRPDPDQWRHLAERMFEAAGDHVPTPAEVEQFAECFRRMAVAGARTGQTEWIIAGIAQQCGPDVAEHAGRLIRAILSPKKMER